MDEWIHLAGSWDGASRILTLTINGVSVYTLDLVDADYDLDVGPQDGYGVMRIGVAPVWTGEVLVDNVRVWNQALSQTEIDQGRWNLVVNGSDTRLLRDFRFDDGGATVEDFVHPSDADYLLVAATYGVGTNASGHAYWLRTNAVALYGIDDADGDSIPDWWTSLHKVTGSASDPDSDFAEPTTTSTSAAPILVVRDN